MVHFFGYLFDHFWAHAWSPMTHIVYLKKFFFTSDFNFCSPHRKSDLWCMYAYHCTKLTNLPPTPAPPPQTPPPSPISPSHLSCENGSAWTVGILTGFLSQFHMYPSSRAFHLCCVTVILCITFAWVTFAWEFLYCIPLYLPFLPSSQKHTAIVKAVWTMQQHCFVLS